MDWILYIVAALLAIAGVAGTVIPAMPGVPLVFLGLLLAAWVDGFARVGGWSVAILGVLSLIVMVVDFVAARMGAKRAGASPRAVIGATIGMFIGIFFGIPGLLLGPFIGAIIGEISVGRTFSQAGKAGIGTWLGLVIGTAVKLAIIAFMIGFFLISYFW